MSLLTSRTSESMSRYIGFQPNNVWCGLEHLRPHEHGELSDLWFEPEFVMCVYILFSFNGLVQCTIDYTGHALHAQCYVAFSTIRFSSDDPRTCGSRNGASDPCRTMKIHVVIGA